MCRYLNYEPVVFGIGIVVNVSPGVAPEGKVVGWMVGGWEYSVGRVEINRLGLDGLHPIISNLNTTLGISDLSKIKLEFLYIK